MREFHAIITIAFRDPTKLVRDKTRVLSSLFFPVIFIGVLGGSLEASLGQQVAYDFITFVFIGVLMQTLFQSTAAGVIFLLEDRDNDFSQELFIAPVSPRSIVFGKILGEALVALTQGIGVVVFGLIIGVSLSFWEFLMFLPLAFVSCLLGGAFGIFILSNLSSERTVRQIFPFVVFPQLFLAGVFTPITELPAILTVLSRVAPLTYVVDLARGLYYWNTPFKEDIVLFHPLFDLAAIILLFLAFLVVGTFLFVRREKNR